MRRRALPRALAVAAALLLLVFELAWYADRTLLDADRFADRGAASLEDDPVREAVARRVTEAALAARPDLVAVRPLVQGAADAVLRTEAFRSLLRAALRDLHRSALDPDADTLTLRIADTGILLSEALQRIRPDLADRVPEGLATSLGSVGGGGLDVLDGARAPRRLRAVAIVALVLGLVLAAGSVLLDANRRAAVRRLGLAGAAAGVAAVVALLAGRAVAAGQVAAADRDAVRGLWDVWWGDLRTWNVVLIAAGLVVAAAADSLLRPPAPGSAVRALRGLAAATGTPRLRAVRAAGLVLAGALILAARDAFLALVAAGAGLALVYLGVVELLRLVARPDAERPARRRRPSRAAWRAAAVAAAALVLLVAGGAVATRGGDAAEIVRCNGSRELCERPLDAVAFAGTHNSMAAADGPGWLFAAQEDGIVAQLEAGVRALLIDTHYGYATPRGVATDLGAGSKSRAKLVDEVGERFVETAERLRERIGYRGGGEREVFLCHAFCEVGATPAVEALEEVNRFLVTHPGEVIVISFEDEIEPRDTEAIMRAAGLLDLVYRGPARPPWPSLGELIERGERVLVLAERDTGGLPWLHLQPDAMQETPYSFASPAQLAEPAACEPNRGGTRGSLLLVNHWVDTSPAPRPALADEVNAAGFLLDRLRRCRQVRRLLPNVVAVDFYRRGGLLEAVDSLNGLASAKR